MKYSRLVPILFCLMMLPSCTAESRASTIQQKAAQGDVHAEAVLGEMYAQGNDVPKDYALAAKWWSKSAAAGMAQAQYNLGVLYEHGQGVPQSDKTAAGWYSRAAQQGLAAAEYNIGVFYQYGRGGLGPSAEAAASWYLKAAQQGHPDAQYNLGALYMRQHPEEAYFWLSLVARNGDHQAEMMRDQVAKALSPAQVTQERRRVDDWRAVPAPG